MSEHSNDSTGAASAPSDEVTVSLHRAEALVAFDFIARLVEEQEGEALRETFEHPAELASLWALIAALEQVLSEPFAEDYRAAIDTARAEVLARMASDAPDKAP